jgi:GT2 family glycosyltransferase
MLRVSVVIVSFNVKHFITLCIDSVKRALATLPNGGEIIVVDNNSKDGSVDFIRKHFPDVQLIDLKQNIGFGKANNIGIEKAKGDYILILNPDTVMPEHFLSETIAYMDAHPEVGCLGPRLIDGKGIFAPDGKKSFPSLRIALFKTLGFGKLFPKSPYFNAYYAVHIPENEIAEVEVLSGCCMLLRRSVIPDIGGIVFDEAYFMYCEDVDLSYRIQKAGHKNVYYPKVDLIHFKGESTKKATLSYVKIFNEALLTFVKKHYPASYAKTFIVFIKIGIALRAVLGILKNIFNALKMPLLDLIFLIAIGIGIHNFWVVGIKEIEHIDIKTILSTIPIYLLIWVGSLYFSGSYDQPYRALRIVRGMLVGTVLCLAYFGLLPAELRYSRAVVVFTGLIAAVAIPIFHELLALLGIYKLVRYNQHPKRSIFIGTAQAFNEVKQRFSRFEGAPKLLGYISVNEQDKGLGTLQEITPLSRALYTNELIYNPIDLSYAQTLALIQTNKQLDVQVKFHLPQYQFFIGSDYSGSPGEVYDDEPQYRLAAFSQLRNKRVFDILLSLMVMILSPILLFTVKRTLVPEAIRVMLGQKTWIGYANELDTNNTTLISLPKIRPGVFPCYVVQDAYTPNPAALMDLNKAYAKQYTAMLDWYFFRNNFM